MNTHPAKEDLRRWRRGHVDEQEMTAIAEHLSTCNECVADATADFDLDRAAIALCDELAESEEEQDTSDPRRAMPKRAWLLALAASLAIAIASTFWMRTRVSLPRENTPRISRVTPAPPPPAIDESEELARAVREGAPIAMPDRLRSVLGDVDVLRGVSTADGAFAPAGVVVTSARPRFTWPAPRGSRSVVEIFSGETEVVRSAAIATTHWEPARELPRGRTYTWTVTVEHDGTARILPASPAAVARFHVLDQATVETLESAERRHAADHFLLGLLYARAGIVDAAREHLRLVTRPDDVAVAGRVLQDLEAWSAR